MLCWVLGESSGGRKQSMSPTRALRIGMVREGEGSGMDTQGSFTAQLPSEALPFAEQCSLVVFS